jgi:hypothetical protein
MPISMWLPTWTHLSQCLHWPFCPGVFIALLGFLAAVVTFWEGPPKPVKALCVALFFVIMCCEIWMMSKDADKRETAEREARGIELGQTTMLNTLTIQFALAQSQLATLGQEMDAAKGNPQLLNSLRVQVSAEREESNKMLKQILFATVPVVADQLDSLSERWSTERQQPDNQGIHPFARVNAKWYGQAKPSLITADSLRQQLLQELPPTAQTSDDKSEADAFAKAIKGANPNDLKTIASYLRELSSRVASSTQSRDQTQSR